jgi:hypothetical protein
MKIVKEAASSRQMQKDQNTSTAASTTSHTTLERYDTKSTTHTASCNTLPRNSWIESCRRWHVPPILDREYRLQTDGHTYSNIMSAGSNKTYSCLHAEITSLLIISFGKFVPICLCEVYYYCVYICLSILRAYIYVCVRSRVCAYVLTNGPHAPYIAVGITAVEIVLIVQVDSESQRFLRGRSPLLGVGTHTLMIIRGWV